MENVTNSNIKSPKKLIEVALPLDTINAACAYEKMPGIGASALNSSEGKKKGDRRVSDLLVVQTPLYDAVKR